MIKKYLLLLFTISFLNNSNAQAQLSVYAEVSVVTAGPGTVLYEAFGHSAIRIKDPVLNIDLAYNYGMFDFNEPNFYSNFAKGNLIYSLARYDFKYFLASYKRDKRWLKQQVLNINQAQKQAFFMYLENNATPENAKYNYDPYFNNCATKLRDITTTILGDKVSFKEVSEPENLTFRQLTNKEIHWNSWGTVGLNTIAGTILDKKATSDEYMYLPDYVYASFKDAILFERNEPQNLIKREDVLLKFDEIKQTSDFISPFLVFICFAILVFFITYKDLKNNKRTKSLDFTLLFITGFIGILLVFLWFFSTHTTAPNNFNILWAFAPNLIVAFFMLKKTPPKWCNYYFKFVLILILIIPILWLSKIQSFPIAAIPLYFLLLGRYLFLSKNNS
ncbi:DUF4105 domain-containing protein [Polaribacter sp.]|uniref:lipoprotein N-acyltransferase Lnb domain-containing protein n=1 Tax=Polaribacter sp. TaxID=1920175 RepID=UPI003EF5E919